MKRFLELHEFRSYLYIVYGLLFLLFTCNFFIDSNVIHLVVSWSSILIFIISWLLASKLFKIISAFFVISGISMSLSGNIPWYEIPNQTSSTLPMLVFLSILPWMSSVGEYDQSLEGIIQPKSDNLSELYTRGFFTIYSLVIFINVSAIYMYLQILINKMKNIEPKTRHSFLIQTSLRALALAVIWSPMEILVGMTVDGTNISYLTYLPWLLLCSILTAIIDIVISKWKFKDKQTQFESIQIDKKLLWIAFIKLIIILCLFLATIVTVNHFFNMNFILSVSLVIFPFAFIWSIFMRNTAIFLKGGWQSWTTYNNEMQNLVALFLSLAFFSNGFNNTNFPNLLQSILNQISDFAILIFIFITAVYFIFAMIGVHPIATIAVLLEILRPLFDVINPLSIGIVLIVSSLSISASAPYGISATLTAQQLGVSPYQVTKQNFFFSVLMSLIGILIGIFLL
ncbi:hypothetical protein [Bacillus sp. REN16]|uniref:hypothetical protein n=1 Tax=Bacillus sp. REN16 TaxID=2887296 RepID=UPI001E3D049F|nr:hypothetical protein [Bacillus sp. REN16]MCC3358978.1 hypothetical protein [Bacillus sp. REN16]